MNPFIEAFESAVEQTEFYSESDEQAYLEYIFEHSPYTDIEQFVQSNISYEAALTVAQSDDQFIEDAIDYIEDSPVFTSKFIDPNTTEPNKLAYILAYEYPGYASELLNELLYYRERNRI